jgi:hypothetical protein
MTFFRRQIQRLGPYQALILVLIPGMLVEPLKIVAVWVAGEGHWLTGTAMIVAAYAASLLAIERLFRVTKPKLMTLNRFPRLWTWSTDLHRGVGRARFGKNHRSASVSEPLSARVPIE